jgi:putative FmdB family regulatory protein
MPVFEYQCERCGHAFDALVRNDADRRNVACPKCDAKKVERRLSVFAAHASAGPAPAGGACMRCGDPDGPCS